MARLKEQSVRLRVAELKELQRTNAEQEKELQELLEEEGVMAQALREYNRGGIRRRGRSLSATPSEGRGRPEGRDDPIEGRGDFYSASPPPQRRRLGSVEEPLRRAYIIRPEKLDQYQRKNIREAQAFITDTERRFRQDNSYYFRIDQEKINFYINSFN